MITTLLIQIGLVLSALIALTLFYFLVVYVSGVYAPEICEIGELSVFSYTRKTETAENDKKNYRAVIHCNLIPPRVPQRFKTAGYTDCRTQNMVFNGHLVCESGCLGLGSCAKKCPNDSIIVRNGEIGITDSCTGCGNCVSVCPKNLISIIPADETSIFSCAARSRTDATAFCKTAQDGYLLDFHNFSESGFKNLHKWDILKRKSR